MAFDGLAHEVGSLIPPYYSHPRAVALGDGLSQALRHSYSTARLARPIGTQSHPIIHGDRSYSGTLQVPALPFSEIVRFSGVAAPEHATAIVAKVSYAVLPGTGVQAFHQLAATDGTNTDTSPTITTEVADLEETFLGIGFHDWQEQLLLLQLSTLSLASLSTITVRAHASDQSGGQILYQPAIASAWWITEG